MTTPFDEVIEQIRSRGFHNQRLEDHSDTVSDGILRDLRRRCDSFAADFSRHKIQSWKNVRTPGARNRKIDLLVGEPDVREGPDPDRLRFCVENKSVVTAHRNLYARFDDLTRISVFQVDYQIDRIKQSPDKCGFGGGCGGAEVGGQWVRRKSNPFSFLSTACCGSTFRARG
jgi:hypothetical protein